MGLDYEFAWQRGYGALSLGERQRPQAEEYVVSQKTHHDAQTPIAWLERDSEADKGPIDPNIVPDAVPVILRESRATYVMEDESPF